MSAPDPPPPPPRSAAKTPATAPPAAVAQVALPLPAEIMEMADAETACTYCGVSYLILSRMDALQREFARLERELDDRKQYAVEKPALEAELDQAWGAVKALTSRALDAEQERDDAVSANVMLRKHMGISAAALTQRSRNLAALEAAREHIYTRLGSARAEVRALKSVIADQRRSIVQIVAECKSFADAAVQQVVCDLEAKAQERLRGQHAELQAHADRAREVDRLQYQQQLQAVDDRCVKLERQIADLKKERVDTEQLHLVEKEEQASLLQDLDQANQETRQELDQLRTERTAFAAENKALAGRVTLLESILGRANMDLDQEHAAKRAALAQIQQLQDSLAAARATQSLSVGQKDAMIDSLRQHLAAAERDRQSLARDLDETVVAHQSRIADLQAAFQQKLAAAVAESGTQWRAQCEKQVDVARRETAHAVRECQRLMAQVEVVEKEAKERMCGEEARVAKVGEEGREAMRKLTVVERELTKARHHLAQLQTRARDHESTIASLTAAIQRHEAAASQRDLTASRDAAAQCQRDRAAWAAARTALEEELQVLKDTIRHECAERVALVEQLDALKEENMRRGSADSGLNEDRATPHHEDVEVAEKGPVDALAHMFESKMGVASAKKAQKLRRMQRRT
ncbi:hypothetical protein AMAG_07330 [Allomyces macrogynus ATCC 38327]|uniref:Uncharacterized protein n=1 Tax=Allomyces macrogynus (strain ATCC 38327) TaxID=578462 RepID=A0A0L0SHU4_ALLM3|nr:hypothetical protein AMAG_07330 [Allomyces macrogynus ATCC 38327]|eukprot:KNE62076.1 hypothetical protein AMAG_07330 [Allomyces macrogynus ATCC 38327]